MCSRPWLRVSPVMVPRAFASVYGLRFPWKYSSTRTPLDPGGMSLDASFSTSYGEGPPFLAASTRSFAEFSRNHRITDPVDAWEASIVYCPRTRASVCAPNIPAP